MRVSERPESPKVKEVYYRVQEPMTTGWKFRKHFRVTLITGAGREEVMRH